MPKVALFNQDGTEAGDLELNESVFGIEPNNHVIHEVVIMQRAAKRQGNHAVKNRSEVRGGGRKPWRQKGTGRARQGSIRSPQWVGGGVVFGPTTDRNYKYKLPKKVRKLALKSALSSKVNTEDLIVLNDLQFEVPKTKDVVAVLNALDVNDKVLIVTSEKNENVVRSANNLQTVKVITVGEINVLDLVAYDKVILTKDAAEKAGEVLA
ncbi:50S ribosomal protein L4 [Pseudogracilibacillus sp. SO30301A]|uniref:50S ribosomal protein L4 n=1 Tax=Pseudogracilibacillus sp. SO30301A TaxID=3098291 RepID=UPI00300DD922